MIGYAWLGCEIVYVSVRFQFNTLPSCVLASVGWGLSAGNCRKKECELPLPSPTVYRCVCKEEIRTPIPAQTQVGNSRFLQFSSKSCSLVCFVACLPPLLRSLDSSLRGNSRVLEGLVERSWTIHCTVSFWGQLVRDTHIHTDEQTHARVKLTSITFPPHTGAKSNQKSVRSMP